MTLAERIVTEMISRGVSWPGGPSNAVIVRTRAGRHQRACGAWSWFLKPKNPKTESAPDVGSSYTATEIAKGFFISWSPKFHSYELYPEDDSSGTEELPADGRRPK